MLKRYRSLKWSALIYFKLICIIWIVMGDPQLVLGEMEVEHRLDIQPFGTRIVAIRSHAQNVEIDLRLEEKLIWKDVYGGLGVVVTTDRFLVVTLTSESWLKNKLYSKEGGYEKEGVISSDLVLYNTATRFK